MKKIIRYTLIGAVALFMSSCKDFLNINTDPSVPQKVGAITLMAPIYAQMVRGEAFDTRYFGLYTQMFAVNSTGDNWERHGYVSGNDAGGEKWRSHYYSIGRNIDLVIEDGTAASSYDLVGAAKAIRAWSWQTSTDVYNEMILTQAFEPNRYVFDFDTQDKIYAEVVRLSNEAIADFDKGGAKLKPADIVYAGDVAKWKKFIYGNLARNANHISNKSSYKPDDVIKYCDLSLAANTDNFNVPHVASSSVDANFFGPLRNNMSAYRASLGIVKLLDGTVFGTVRDPRLPIMIAPCPDSIFRGIQTFTTDPGNVSPFTTKRIPNLWGAVPGATTPALAANAGFATNGRWIFKDAEPHYLMTASEIQFIKAEAAFRKGDKPLAFAAFKKGIELHMDFCGVTAANKTAFMTSAAIKTDATMLTLADIMQQKYIALWGHGALEAWVDMRRFKYDTQVYTTFVTPTTAQYFPDNNGKLAYRVRPRYNSEYVWNRAALDKFKGNDADYHTIPTWFSE
jgi:hypothetical protein